MEAYTPIVLIKLSLGAHISCDCIIIVNTIQLNSVYSELAVVMQH